MADITSRRFKIFNHDDMMNEDDVYSTESKGEVREWTEVNRQLRKQGFQSVRVLPAKDVPHLTGRYICLDPDSNELLRHNMLTLLAECDHRQTLVHDLMEANKQLKEDMVALTEKADKERSKAKDLKIMLECSRKRVQELERERDTSVVTAVEEGEKGRNLRNAIHKRCKQLEEAFAEKEIELDKTLKKLRILNEEEERRVKRQNEVFQEFKKRTARAHSLTDGKLLDIIDLYESQLYDLKQELEAAKRGESRLQEQDTSFTAGRGLEPMKNAKHIIKGLERQLQEADRRAKALEDEKELLSLEMGSSIPGEKNARDPFRAKRKYSTNLENLEYLPVDICQRYLRELCSELGVDDVENVLPEIRELSRRLEMAGQYQEFCYNLQQIVTRMQNPSRATRHCHHGSGGRGDNEALSEGSIRQSLEIVENWRLDMVQLQELQESLNRLLEQLTPRARIHFTPTHSMADMTEIIDSLADEETTAVTKEGYEHISRSTLESMVQHFQTLFDVPAVSGMLTAMTDIYRRFGEAQNVLNTLRNLLGLADDCNSASVVDAVGRLCQAHNSTTSRQLQQLFETDDLASVIKRLDEHNEFFPAFKEIMCKLMEILVVERMDQVIPAVRALKMLTS
ncbi:centrosomal protein of 70 kDa-like isoform X2 [Babylonia areolata]|uniref:centrosomal protein of 70 kDa-like isoform X2 n=1 Tax=Babylonia areolata TaxID=304850 RepID=UPI003FCFEAB9